MDILNKEYEISIWDDIQDGDSFKEVKRCIIGSNQFQGQNRVFEPTLTRNVNGSKKFSFKLYKRYIDSVSGEWTENVFADELYNERKVKLDYEGITYNFIVKKVEELSNNYLFSYTLEDEWVNELSKSGYGVTLDDQRMNNLGTIGELAERVLENTDWTVSEDSEIIVEKISENLVYLQLPNVIPSNTIYQILDQTENNLKKGVESKPLSQSECDELSGATILAFYSSCTNKPYRFQFIFQKSYQDGDGKANLPVDTLKNISVANCQYYFDINADYYEPDEKSGYYLPYLGGQRVIFASQSNSSLKPVNDTQVSSWYRGNRYGFAHKGTYLPILDKFVNEYYDEDNSDDIYYGYTESEVISPAVIFNFIANPDLIGSSSWFGANGLSTVESIYGRWSKSSFIGAQEDLLAGRDLGEVVDGDKISWTQYLHVKFSESGAEFINTGPYDLRTTIEELKKGEQWACSFKAFNYKGEEVPLSNFSISIREMIYETATGNYINKEGGKQAFYLKYLEPIQDANGLEHYVCEVNKAIDPEEFKKNTKFALVIKCKNSGDYYFQNFKLFKAYYDKNEKIIPLEQYGSYIESQTKINYYYINKQEADNAKNIESIKKNIGGKYTYKPLFEESAQKIRTIKASKSNYFNILQTIAETFQAWLEIRSFKDTNGQTKKEILFRNHTGQENYSGFKYGINLKDIQRNKESNGLITKLIVNANNNQYAEGGSCSIAKAQSNPSGETSLYDFQYYFNMKLMDENEYNKYVFGDENSVGYYDLIKNQNQIISQTNEIITQESISLQKYETEYQVASSSNTTITDQLRSNGQEIEDILKVPYSAIRGLQGDPDQKYLGFNGLTDFVIDLQNAAELTSNSTASSLNGRIKWLPTSQDTVTATMQKVGNKVRFKFKRKYQKGKYFQGTYTYKQIYTWQDWVDLLKDKEIPELKDGQYYSILPADESFTEEDFKELEIPDGLNIKETTYYYKDLDTGESTATWKNSVPSTYKRIYDTDPVPQIQNRQINKLYIDTLTKPNNAGREKFVLVYNDALGKWPDEDSTYTPSKGYGEDLTLNITFYPIVSLGTEKDIYDQTVTVFRTLTFELDTSSNEGVVEQEETIDLSLNDNVDEVNAGLGTILETAKKTVFEREDLLNVITKRGELLSQLSNAQLTEKNSKDAIEKCQKKIDEQQVVYDAAIKSKQALQKAFQKKYSRFIREGTWSDENYHDDEDYYHDARTVLDNSCYPQVKYTINLLNIDASQGYELYNTNLGDRTFVYDPIFFGKDKQETVVVTEIKEVLDDASKKTIQVQNYKDSFKDLFQRITATVQNVEYKKEAYNRAAELVTGSANEKGEFIQEGLENSNGVQIGGMGMTISPDGAYFIDKNSGAGLRISTEGKIYFLSIINGEEVWTEVFSGNNGIPADKISGGKLDVNEVSLVSGDANTFKWNKFGLSALEDEKNNFRFVRFDKYGIYGMDYSVANGALISSENYHPSNINELIEHATFALTWEGLKVTGDSGVVAKIGKDDKGIIRITKNVAGYTQDIFSIDNYGDLKISGVIEALGGKLAGWTIEEDTITSGKFGETGIHLSTNGKINTDRLFGNDNFTDFWMLAIGDSFGVTKDGGLYAKRGRIGDCIIEKDQIIMGQVTLRETTKEVYKVIEAEVDTLIADQIKAIDIVANSLYVVDDEGSTLVNISAQDKKAVLAGWQIRHNEIYTGSLGSPGSFVLAREGWVTNKYLFGSDTIPTAWAIGVGSTFGVTLGGGLHATSGKIAGWSFANNGFYHGTLGQEGSATFSLDGMKNINRLFGNNDTSAFWSFAVGKYFGVTSKGEIYGTRGCFGGWDINDSGIYHVDDTYGQYLYAATDENSWSTIDGKQHDLSYAIKREVTVDGAIEDITMEFNFNDYSPEQEVYNELSCYKYTISMPENYIVTEIYNYDEFSYDTWDDTDSEWYYGGSLNVFIVPKSQSIVVYVYKLQLDSIDWGEKNILKDPYRISYKRRYYKESFENIFAVSKTGFLYAIDGRIGPLKISEGGIGINKIDENNPDNGSVYITINNLQAPRARIGNAFLGGFKGDTGTSGPMLSWVSSMDSETHNTGYVSIGKSDIRRYTINDDGEVIYNGDIKWYELTGLGSHYDNIIALASSKENAVGQGDATKYYIQKPDNIGLVKEKSFTVLNGLITEVVGLETD